MKEALGYLMETAISKGASDIHMTVENHHCTYELRVDGVLTVLKVKKELEDGRLFQYLKFIAHCELADASRPQTGSFVYDNGKKTYACRFAVMSTRYRMVGVIRILDRSMMIPLNHLTPDNAIRMIFEKMIRLHHGLIILSGATGSGKTTSAYSLLNAMKSRKIYTIEELCYYICNNLYLIDYTIMNAQLCDWLDEELGMDKLASDLKDVLRLHGSVEKFVLTILKASKIYREPEMIRIQNVLEHLKNQKDIERQKYKGDNLLESGEVEEAILVYQAILNQEKDESVDEKFYGKIYAGLGAAYGRLFLYQEAARMYDRAYQICQDKALIKPYLYASYKYMSLEEYHILITKQDDYMEINAQMRREIDEIRENMSEETDPDLIEKWKRQHRRNHS